MRELFVPKRRRRSLWSWLKAHAWLVRLGLALAAAALGLYGLTRQDDPGPWPERVYSVLQLFVLETGDISSPLPRPLSVARFLAAGVAASALWGALALLFAEHFAKLRVRWFLKDHVVVCGLGRNGTLIAHGFRMRGDDVVGVDLGHSEGIDETRAEGTIVLVGDATETRVLEQAGVPRARLLVVTCGGDGTNAEIAIAARATVPGGRDHPLTCLVHIADSDLSALLTESEIADPLPGAFRLDFFDAVERGVTELMCRDEPLVHEGERGPHLLVVGLGHVGRSVVIHAGRAWGVAGTHGRRELRITVVDIDAEARVADLCARYPGLARGCDIDAWAVDVTATEFEDGASLYRRNLEWPFSRAYVCLSDDARSIGAALVVRRRLPDPRVPIVVRTSHRRGLARLLDETTAGPFAFMRAFSPSEWMCRPEALLGGRAEILARAIHEEYVRNRRMKGGTGGDRSSVDWEDLPEDLRESNRRLAREIGEKLRTVGCRLQPLSDWHAEPETLSAEEVEHLAAMEHEAWQRERQAGGWTYYATKDVDRRRSPYLVAWDELPSRAKDIDRELIRGLPAFLATAGFAVVRTTAIGATGHRVLTDVDELARGIDAALHRIESTHPGRPLTVVSALAEGADRLVARRVLSRPGSRLVAALPLPADDYLQDFSDESSRQEFRRLLARAEQVVELPAAATREEAYEQVGGYVLGRCDVLLALWDGAVSQGRGGTADVVDLARRRHVPLAWVHAGNRGPNTLEATSLGNDQGLVTFENL